MTFTMAHTTSVSYKISGYNKHMLYTDTIYSNNSYDNIHKTMTYETDDAFIWNPLFLSHLGLLQQMNLHVLPMLTHVFAL